MRVGVLTRRVSVTPKRIGLRRTVMSTLALGVSALLPPTDKNSGWLPPRLHRRSTIDRTTSLHSASRRGRERTGHGSNNEGRFASWSAYLRFSGAGLSVFMGTKLSPRAPRA